MDQDYELFAVSIGFLAALVEGVFATPLVHSRGDIHGKRLEAPENGIIGISWGGYCKIRSKEIEAVEV